MTNKKKCLLIKLPPELRNQIYELVLIQDEEIDLATFYPSFWEPPALLEVCRRIRDEAIPIYYGMNTFTCGSFSASHGEFWLRALDERSRLAIRRLHVDDGVWTLPNHGDEFLRGTYNSLEDAGLGLRDGSLCLMFVEGRDGCAYIGGEKRLVVWANSDEQARAKLAECGAAVANGG